MSQITGSASLAIASGPRRAFCGVNFAFNLSSDEFFLADQQVGTGAEALAFGDVTPKLVVVVNQDSTNYVQLGLDSGVSTKIFARLQPGGFAIWEPYTPANTIYAKANSSTCKCAVFGVEGATATAFATQPNPYIVGTNTATAYLNLTGTSGVRGINILASHVWAASSTDGSTPFAYLEQTGTDVAPLAYAGAQLSAGGYLMDIHGDDSSGADGYLSTDSAGSEKVCVLKAGYSFCILPMGPSMGLYCGGADSIHIPLVVTL